MVVSQGAMHKAPVISTPLESLKVTIEDVGRIAAEHEAKLMDQYQYERATWRDRYIKRCGYVVSNQLSLAIEKP